MACSIVQGADLLIGLWLGALGGAYMLYGRKQAAAIPLICGLLLIIEPYVVKGSALQLLIALVLAAFPFVLR